MAKKQSPGSPVAAWAGTFPGTSTDFVITTYDDGTADYITRSTFAGPWDQWSPPIPLDVETLTPQGVQA